MGRDMREEMQRVLLAQAAMLLDLMNCAEYAHDNGVVSVRVARSGVGPVPANLASLLSRWRAEAVVYARAHSNQLGYETHFYHQACGNTLDRAADELEAVIKAESPDA